ncbi:type II secretion system protein [Clostridium sp.]|uniref:type II secretion system protein n=1 Tax=Clostridium sp. TaxID=1506 RepID=UPI003995DE64
MKTIINFFKINSNLKNKKKGFTLIELVAVMAIIAILSAAFIPRFGDYITQAKKVSILNEAKSIVTAYESVKYKSTTKNENETIGSDLQGDNLPIEKDSLKKLGNATVAQCKLLLDTENHDFTLNDNTITISNTDSSKGTITIE